MAEILLIVLGAIFLLAGLVGCILPVLPGPPLAYLALVCLSIARDWEPFSAPFLVGWGAAVVVVTVLDFVVPAVGAKRYGASRAGVWLSVLGMIAGIFFFPPFGMLLGAWLGALLGEFAAGKREKEALRASWGVFVGTVAGIFLKLVVSLGIGVYFVLELVG